MAKLSWSTANSQVADELYNVSSSAAFGLEHDAFYNKTGKLVEIWTGAGGTGTQLTISTDYTISGAIADGDLPASISPDVAYTTVAITNAAYHSTNLYISYYPLGDYIEPGDFQENQGTANKWNSLTTYSAAGTIAERALMHFAASGKATNLNKDPLNQANLAYWIPSPGLQTLMQRCKEPFVDLHPALDRASGDYQNLVKIDTLALDGTTYDFWQIALDGSTVTGDANLVAALDVGGANQHALIDLIAPDSLGTRTLIDMGERVMAGQSASGNNDTRGEVLADRFQGWQAGVDEDNTGAREYWGRSGIRDEATDHSPGSGFTYSLYQTTAQGDSQMIKAKNDGTNGDPRTGATTRPKELTGGSYAILSMVPA